MFHPFFFHHLLQLGESHVTLLCFQLRQPLLFEGLVCSLHTLFGMLVNSFFFHTGRYSNIKRNFIKGGRNTRFCYVMLKPYYFQYNVVYSVHSDLLSVRPKDPHRAMFILGGENLFVLCLFVKNLSAVYSTERNHLSYTLGQLWRLQRWKH